MFDQPAFVSSELGGTDRHHEHIEARRLCGAPLRGAGLDDDAEVAWHEMVRDLRIVGRELDFGEPKAMQHRIADAHRREQASGELVDAYCHRSWSYISGGGGVNASTSSMERHPATSAAPPVVVDPDRLICR